MGDSKKKAQNPSATEQKQAAKKPLKLDLTTKSRGEGFRRPIESIGSVYLLTFLFLLLTLAFLYILHLRF